MAAALATEGRATMGPIKVIFQLQAPTSKANQAIQYAQGLPITG
jgi:hypothetical protein